MNLPTTAWLLLLLVVLPRTSLGQPEELITTGRRCGTEGPDDLQRLKVDADLNAFRQVNANYQRVILDVAIDVRIHVIHDGQSGKLTQADVNRQFDVLNAAYRPCRITFNQKSIDWTDNPKWFNMNVKTAVEREAKRALGREQQQCLNLYFANPGQRILGWATFPSELDGDTERDGVVIKYSTVPGIGNDEFSLGKTAVHEVGHWLGLFHTFQGGCGGEGDAVADTPAEARAARGKPPETTDTCPDQPGNDPVHNYMDYTDDDWMREFTPGQIAFIKRQLGTYRRPLLSQKMRVALNPVDTSGLRNAIAGHSSGGSSGAQPAGTGNPGTTADQP